MYRTSSQYDNIIGWQSATSRLWHVLRWFFCILVFVSLSYAPHFARGQEGEASLINREYPLKAIFLYNFASYVEWPSGTFANEKTPLVIGAYGSLAIDDTLQTIANSKKVGERKLEFRKFASVKEIKNCQILFVSRDVSASQHLEILKALKDKPVLVVGESQGFAAQGAAINFFIEANKIRFEVNTDVTKRLGLKVSSKLLSMAKIVSDDTAKK